MLIFLQFKKIKVPLAITQKRLQHFLMPEVCTQVVAATGRNTGNKFT